ncbi:MAG: hypothetical protein EVA65_04125 [Oceanococcus sp.]|nr:MAG: hypothetical protein EVA65_04125 [Oceanococcus sp.]
MSETQRTQAVEGRIALRDAAIELVGQARGSLYIATMAMEPALFRDPQLLDALKYQLLDERRLKVKVLVSEARRARPHADLFIALLRRLSSRFSVHEPSNSQHGFTHDWWIADRKAHLRRNHPDNLISSYAADDPIGAHNLRDDFDAAWLDSVPSLEFRQLS